MLIFKFQLQDVLYYRSSDHFYDQTVCGKIISVGRKFTVAGSPNLKVNFLLTYMGFVRVDQSHISLIFLNILLHFYLFII